MGGSSPTAAREREIFLPRTVSLGEPYRVSRGVAGAARTIVVAQGAWRLSSRRKKLSMLPLPGAKKFGKALSVPER